MQTLNVDQLVGKTLGAHGEYQVERLLGQGQLSSVYIARQRNAQRTVMVIVFNIPEGISLRSRERFLARFTQEGTILSKLKHPNILPTYDFGNLGQSPYLVTEFVKTVSLAQVLKQQKRFTPQQALHILRQIAEAFDYAHDHGVIHGMFSSTNIVMKKELTIQIAGFGLRTILEVLGDEQHKLPHSHLFSANGAFLGNAAYIAPERVLDMAVGVPADIYALGVLLFEMLSGTLPFSGENSLETAMRRIEQPVPSLHKVAPDVPEALDLVISKAMERNPERRYSRAGEMVSAMERILTVLEASPKTVASRSLQSAQDIQATLPPTVNWLAEEDELMAVRQWQFLTNQVPSVQASTDTSTNGSVGKGAGQLPVQITETTPPGTEGGNSLVGGVDPFTWWAANATQATPVRKQATAATPGMFSRSSGRRTRFQQERRRVVSLIATGVVAAGVVAVGGISFANFMQSLRHGQVASTQTQTTGTTPSTQGQTPTSAPTMSGSTQKTPAHSTTPTAKVQPTPTKGIPPTPQPTTPRPTPTPTQPSHTGTVIGSTSQGTNTAKSFNNPADGNGSLLIHLTNGKFVACEKACTHEGVPIYYDAGQQKLVCPAHGAVFDPFNGFSVVSGPAPSAQPGVSVRVNADGTITTG